MCKMYLLAYTGAVYEKIVNKTQLTVFFLKGFANLPKLITRKELLRKWVSKPQNYKKMLGKSPASNT